MDAQPHEPWSTEAAPPRGERPPALALVESPVPATAPRQPVRRRRSRGRRLLVTACWSLPLAALVIAAVAMFVAKVVYGLTPLSVRSGSMEPTIPTFALAFVERVPAEQVRIGDVITFDPPGGHTRVTHRVVKSYVLKGSRYFETRGDANPSVDDWRTASGRRSTPAPGASGTGTTVRQSRGIAYGNGTAVRYVFHVPWLGRVGVWLERPGVREKVPFVPFVLLALWMLGMIWGRPMAPRPDAAEPREQPERPLLDPVAAPGVPYHGETTDRAA